MRGGQDEWLQGTGDRVLDLNTSYGESTFQWRPKVGMLLSRLATKILVSTAPSACCVKRRYNTFFNYYP